MRQRRRLFPLLVLISMGFAPGLRAQVPVITASSASDSISDQRSNELQEFVKKIAAAAGAQRAISLGLNNISDLDAARVRSMESDLRAELGRAGFQVSAVGTEGTELKIEVTLSKSAGGYLWIAEVGGRAEGAVAIEAVHDAQGPRERARTAPILRRTVVQEQAEPMLDFAEIASADGTVRLLLLLEPDRIVIFTGNRGAWIRGDSTPIAHARPWPRDVRGHLAVAAGGGFHAFLPGVLCTGNSSAVSSVSCREDSAAWKLADDSEGSSFVADRNYFSGLPAATNDEAEAFSMVSDSGTGSLRWVVAGADGNARLFQRGEAGAILSVHWGDDIATVATSCGVHWGVLATGTGDWTQQDRLQSYEIDAESAAPAGEPLEFPGPVLALWPSEDLKSVRAISRNLETGRYEASIVSVSCGN